MADDGFNSIYFLSCLFVAINGFRMNGAPAAKPRAGKRVAGWRRGSAW